jgi:hypothetical protein
MHPTPPSQLWQERQLGVVQKLFSCDESVSEIMRTNKMNDVEHCQKTRRNSMLQALN